MAKFFALVEMETLGECIVEAPTLEAAEAWMEQEKRDRFRNWFLDANDSDYSISVTPSQTNESADIYVNEEGKEYTPERRNG